MSRVPAGRAGALVALATSLAPALAEACAVCGTATDRNRWAFFVMTIVMSLLPLALFAAGGWWLRRGMRAAAARERAAEPARSEATEARASS